MVFRAPNVQNLLCPIFPVQNSAEIKLNCHFAFLMIRQRSFSSNGSRALHGNVSRTEAVAPEHCR